jgi:hypothetical protein
MKSKTKNSIKSDRCKNTASATLAKSLKDQIYDLSNCIHILRNELSDKDQVIKDQTEKLNQLSNENLDLDTFSNQLLIRLAKKL